MKKVSLLVVMFLQVLSLASGGLIQWEIENGGNGHWYEVISEKVNWETAQTTAINRSGYLATITSESENQFIFSIIDSTEYWYYNSYNDWSGPWIGGTQIEGSIEPSGGWTWVTGENFIFTAWAPNQPNNAGGNQNRIQYWNSTEISPTWHDAAHTDIHSYVIEYDVVPEPCSLVLLGLGGLLLRKREV